MKDINYDKFRRECGFSKLVMMVPEEVVDGIMLEVYLEGVRGEIEVYKDKYLFGVMVKRFEDRLKNYLAGKQVTCRLTGDVFKKGCSMSVSIDDMNERGMDIVDVVDDSYESYGEEVVEDDIPTVDDLALAIANLSAGGSKRFNSNMKLYLNECNSDVQRVFIAALAKAESIREERYKNRKH